MEALIQRITEAHNGHYDFQGNNTLLQIGNWVCHLYGDGEITFTNGGALYGHRNTRTIIPGMQNIMPLFLPVTGPTPAYSYAILTDAECFAFRREMEHLFSNKESI
jgi:hypothetical protein